jgi:hypothetical protein
MTRFTAAASLVLMFSSVAFTQGPPPPPGGGGGGGGQSGDGIWYRNAYYGEAQTFDRCLGHQPQNGQYHHHVQPICLRAELDDNLDLVRTGRTGSIYREKASNWKHSPILGWSFDGYPIYGPYGYSDLTNPNSAIKRIKSGFQLRNITKRTTLPAWSLGYHTGVSATLQTTQYGPDVSTDYPLGRYIEDFDYVAGSGDLDVYNGRFTVTPEYPQGTYAYYATVNDDGTPAFPYVLGMQYYGSVTGGSVTSIPSTARDYFANGSVTGSSTTPAVTSWYTAHANDTALVSSAFDPSAGAESTWPFLQPSTFQSSGSVSFASKPDIQRVRYTDAAVYINGNGLASYVMGPWFSNSKAGVFQNWPSNQNVQAQIPVVPSAASTKKSTPLGAVGLWVDGVAV